MRLIILLSVLVILNACENQKRSRDKTKDCGAAMQYYHEFDKGQKLLYINHSLSSSQAKIYARDVYDLVLVNELLFDIDSCWRPLLDQFYRDRFGISYASFEIKLLSEVDSLAIALPEYVNHDGTYNFATERPLILDSIGSDFFRVSMLGEKTDTISVPIEVKIDTLGRIVDLTFLSNTKNEIDSLIRSEIVKDYPVYTVPRFRGDPIVLRYWPVDVIVVKTKDS